MTRAEAIDFLKAGYPDSCYKELREAVDMAVEALKEPERKKGKWILCENPIYSSFRISDADPYLCTVCNMKNHRQTKYCSNCGARMVEEDG